MAAPVAQADGDPFPLLHLADLSFDISSAASLADLAAYQLALAPWSASWDDSMAASLKRTWRRRREKARPLITAREPMGIHAPLDLQQREQFPRFECVDLAFDLAPGANDDLDHLSSAQLAAVQFHPAATTDLVMAAEDLFFARRERDFAAGLSLPPFPPSASSAPSASALAAAAPEPAPRAPAPPATFVDPTPAPLAPRAPTTSRVPPRPAAAPSLPPAPSTNAAGLRSNGGVAAPAASSLAASSSSSSSSSRLPAFARPPVPAPAHPAQPQPAGSASTSASGSRALTSVSSARDGVPHVGERERDRAREDEPRRDRERERASSSLRSERERSLSPGTAQREHERAAYKAAKAARAREDDERERERDAARGERRRAHDEDGPRARERTSGRSSWDAEAGRRAERDRDDRDERERASSPRRPSSSRAYSRARSRSRSPDARRDSGHESSLATPAGRKRAVSPARSDYSHASLRSSTRRRLDDADYVSAPAPAPTPPTGPRRQTPPPDMPRPSESVPLELLLRLHTVFLRHFPGRLSPADIADYVHHGAPTIRAEPVAIKCHSKPNQDFGLPGEAGLEPDVTLAFIMYDEPDIDGARELVRCTDGSRFRDRKITASKGAEQTTSTWRWSDFNPTFVEAHHRRQLAAYATRHLPPALAHAHAHSASTASSLGTLADRMAPPHLPAGVVAAASAPTSVSAGPSAEQGGRRPSTAAPQAPPHVPLPPHLYVGLPTLYVSNVAADTDLGECRDFFDPCDGLVGLSLSGISSSTRALRFRDVWLAFETAQERERSRRALLGGRYPGAAVKLWVENAEQRAQGEQHAWLWNEMSKDYRSKHLSEYETACHGHGGDAARAGSGARSDYSASNPPTPRIQQQQQPYAQQTSPTLDPRRRPSQQYSTANPPTAPAAPSFVPSAQIGPLSHILDSFSTSQSSHSHAYSASQQQQQSTSAPPTRPSAVVPRPGPQTVLGSGPSAYPTDSAMMRPPSAPTTASALTSAPPPPSAPRGAGYMDPARAALLASSGAAGAGAGGDALIDEPMQLDDDEATAVGNGRPTAAEEKARAEEAARSAWGARRGGAAAVGAQVQAQQDGAQQQQSVAQSEHADAGRPRALSLGIKGAAGSSAASSSAETRSPAGTPTTALEPSPAPAPSTPAPAPDVVAADDVAPSISASAFQALGAALKLQGLPAASGGTSAGTGEDSSETP